MKIAQIAPLYEAVPPRLYGGTERVVAHLCDALTELGHEVTLFSSSEARTSARVVAVRDQAIRLDSAPLKSDLAAHLAMLYEVRRRVAQFDVLHFHLDMIHFPMFEQHVGKTITTLHGRLDLKDLDAVYARWSSFGLVSISDAQRAPLPSANWLATVSHGVSPRHFRFNQSSGKYLAFLGRISPEKRPDLAVQLALRSRIPLRIAAKVDAADVVYFENIIKPLLDDPLIDFIGEIGDERKSDFLGNALALVFPVNWPEPFGLAMIEAMACGTPVIAWNWGAVPEVIDHGVTGFIVTSEQEALAALEHLPHLDRAHVRATFDQRFTATTMAHNYLRAYERLLGPRCGLAASLAEVSDERAG
jgi:glycosyltransferase involved in cell wall biosynthesis